MLNQNPTAMVNFMLDDLGSPAGVGLDAPIHGIILITNLDFLKAASRTGGAQQRKTAFGRFKFPFRFQNLRVEKHGISWLNSDKELIYLSTVS